MKLGLCANYNTFKLIRSRYPDAPIEYLEINAGWVASLSDEEFSNLLKEAEEKSITVYSCNGLVPGSLRLTGPDVSLDNVKEYAEKTFARLSALGVKILVFGSSAAKMVPEGFPMEKAWEQLRQIGIIFSETAEKFGQTVIVEGLRRQEVNIVNTLADAEKYIRLVHRDNFRLHADFYHMEQNGEPLSELKEFSSDLCHIHICSSDRGILTKDDIPYISDRIFALKAIGYEGNISYEGKYPEDGNYAPIAEMMHILSDVIKEKD